MMKTCPFCGSPAAAWPEYASDYVRGYPLCQHHMSTILEKATVEEYKTRQAKIHYRQESIRERIVEFIHSIEDDYLLEYLFDDSIDAYNECSITRKFIDKIYDSIPEPSSIGDPSMVYVDESEVDRIMSDRLVRFARAQKQGKPIHRCSGASEFSPDGRCTINVKNHGDLCNRCEDGHSLKISSGHPKMRKALEALLS